MCGACIPLYVVSSGLIHKLVVLSYEAVTAICVVRQRRRTLESLGGIKR